MWPSALQWFTGRLQKLQLISETVAVGRNHKFCPGILSSWLIGSEVSVLCQLYQESQSSSPYHHCCRRCLCCCPCWCYHCFFHCHCFCWFIASSIRSPNHNLHISSSFACHFNGFPHLEGELDPRHQVNTVRYHQQSIEK